MKKLMLGAALLGSAACGQGSPSRIYTGTTTAPEGSTTTSAEPTTTVPATTTTVAPVTTRATHPPRATTTTELPSPQSRSVGRGNEPAGGDTPPEYIKQCESGGDYTAVNPTSGAGGAWQFMPGTWRSVGGTGRPQDATPAEQDYRASLLWNGGNGASHWECA